jgi:peptidoglycan/LPS O-acetylase OafA/YrhL
MDRRRVVGLAVTAVAAVAIYALILDGEVDRPLPFYVTGFFGGLLLGVLVARWIRQRNVDEWLNAHPGLAGLAATGAVAGGVAVAIAIDLTSGSVQALGVGAAIGLVTATLLFGPLPGDER